MPLSVEETKDLLVNLFRLTLATVEKRTDEAVHTFSNILNLAMNGQQQTPAVQSFGLPVNYDCDEMPPLKKIWSSSDVGFDTWTGSSTSPSVGCGYYYSKKDTGCFNPSASEDESEYADMPPLIPFKELSEIPLDMSFHDTRMLEKHVATKTDESEVKLIISEAPVPASEEEEVEEEVEEEEVEEEEVEEEEEEVEEEVAKVANVKKNKVEEEVEEEEVEEEEVEEEAEEEEVEEEAEEEEVEEEAEEEEVEEEAEEEEEGVELALVPVRIKKVVYWKDENSGDIYQYLPDDECGDKVGAYVDGKPVFD